MVCRRRQGSGYSGYLQGALSSLLLHMLKVVLSRCVLSTYALLQKGVHCMKDLLGEPVGLPLVVLIACICLLWDRLCRV